MGESEKRGPYAIRNNKPPVELLIVQVRTKAMCVMPSARLRLNDKQRFIDFVWAGPAGWLWSPTVAQGPATPQVRMGNGRHYEIYRNSMLRRGY